MKKICNFVKNSIIFIYILLIIFVTICLLSYNDYKITVFGDKSLIPIIDENLEPDYTIGDLVIVEKNKLNKVQEGDVVFFYRTFAGEATINYAKLTGVERVTDTEYTFTVEGDYKFSSTYYIGNTESTVIIPKVGHILTILESKWGFLFLGVFPSLVAFLYTLYSIIAEVRYNTDDNDEDESDGKKEKSIKKVKEEKIQEEQIEEDKANIKEPEKIDQKEETKEEVKIEKNDEEFIKENKEENKEEKKEKEADEAKIETEEIKEQPKEEPQKENKTKNITAEQKKALVEAKLKSMTEEQKKALLEAKLKSMTDEEKRALIEAKKKKLEEQKNK